MYPIAVEMSPALTSSLSKLDGAISSVAKNAAISNELMKGLSIPSKYAAFAKTLAQELNVRLDVGDALSLVGLNLGTSARVLAGLGISPKVFEGPAVAAKAFEAAERSQQVWAQLAANAARTAAIIQDAQVDWPRLPSLGAFASPAVELGREFVPPILDVTPCVARESSVPRENREAYEMLCEFEMHLRLFIHDKMSREFGPGWYRSRVASETVKDWDRKKQEAVRAGEPPQPLIYYADFTDYERIIVAKNNWQVVFRPIFVRQTLVQEAFYRLNKVRLPTMHSRPLAPHDVLLIQNETRLILTAIQTVGKQ